MAQFIRAGEMFINIEQVIDVWVKTTPSGTTVEITTTELCESSDVDGMPSSRILPFIGEEAEALAWYFDQEAADVVARMKSRRADQAEHAAMVDALAETQRRR